LPPHRFCMTWDSSQDSLKDFLSKPSTGSSGLPPKPCNAIASS
jgi:hypothetical protein